MKVSFTVETSHTSSPVSEAEGDRDVIIAALKQDRLATEDGALFPPLSYGHLKTLAAMTATQSNRHLHHAMFIVTDEISVVQAEALFHDCVTCRAGTDQAAAMMRENPGKQVAIGLLWFIPR